MRGHAANLALDEVLSAHPIRNATLAGHKPIRKGPFCHGYFRWRDLSRSAAEYLLSIRFGDHDVARRNELSEAARQGKLTSAEQAALVL